ncbi:DUF3147 family protein [Lysinibacillus piscis]|uniref:DUF3147 family protein n=1 Tax=Lysinibacillus piscis TaxID=2518931 RepID=A0ABQ5NKP3_9BACI|nr:DUF3147 family protein [Lysinibacillus sp. KH24]GLC88936.1 hypothetical protein LYSBPC_20630 [Lysinibacillus sp. KH24]
MYTVIKIVISAAIIGIVSEVARKFPMYGGLIAALPLVSILSIIWLTVQHEPNEHIQKFVLGVMIGLPATIIMLYVIYVAMRSSVNIALAIGLGIVSWVICLSVQKMIGQLFQG